MLLAGSPLSNQTAYELLPAAEDMGTAQGASLIRCLLRLQEESVRMNQEDDRRFSAWVVLTCFILSVLLLAISKRF